MIIKRVAVRVRFWSILYKNNKSYGKILAETSVIN